MASRGGGTKPAIITENPCPAGSYWDAYRGLCTGDAYFAPKPCAPGYVWDYGTAACVPIEPFEPSPPIYIEPDPIKQPPGPTLTCPPGYHVVGYDNEGNAACMPDEIFYPIDPVDPIDPIEICPIGTAWSPVTNSCVPVAIDPPMLCDRDSAYAGTDANGYPICIPIVHQYDPPAPQTCPAGMAWDVSSNSCRYVVDDVPVVYPVDPLPPVCRSTEHWVQGVGCVLNQYGDTGTGTGTGSDTGIGSDTGTGTGTGSGTVTTPTPGILDGIIGADGKIFGIEPLYLGIGVVAALFLFSGGGKR